MMTNFIIENVYYPAISKIYILKPVFQKSDSLLVFLSSISHLKFKAYEGCFSFFFFRWMI